MTEKKLRNPRSATSANGIREIPQRPTVVGIGLVALDVIHGLDQPREPELFAGGTCGNVLSALAFLGWNSYPIARLAHDPAGVRALADLRACGARTDFAVLEPTRPTPVFVQRIQADSEGRIVHRFSTRCSDCGGFFPQYQPVPRASMEPVIKAIPEPEVLFVDRTSPGAVHVAEAAYLRGALVYFEPSAKCDERLIQRMLAVSHVLKYSADRADNLRLPNEAVVPLEIETLGADGLRYRGTMLGAQGQRWRAMPAFGVSQLRDAAGAGDWMTAGFIDFIAQAGATGFEGVPRDILEEGLRTGQAFSAWACGFEGARAGMYRQTQAEVRERVEHTLSGRRSRVDAGLGPIDAACIGDGQLCGDCGASAPQGARVS